MSTSNHYVIIGAGPMGLMAAMDLLKAGKTVEIYETDDRIGGMSASFDFDGLAIERYYHFICKTDFPLFQLLDDMKLAHTLRWTETRMGFFYNGTLYKWGTPFALLAFKGLDIVSKMRYAAHVMYTKNIKDWRPLDKVNATSWLRKWVGAKAYDVLWRSLFDLKFFEFTNELSAAWIGTRIKRVGLSRKNLLQETMGYLEGGSGVLLDAMEKYILEHGGKIHLRSKIDKVEVTHGKVSGVIVNGESLACEHVVCTAPIQYVPRLVPDLPADFAERIARIENIPVACVILKLSQPLSENFWMNINDPDIAIPGVIEYSNLNRMTPAVVYAPFYMPKTHPNWARSNDELIDDVLVYLKRINPAFSKEWVLASYCHRYEFAQTICPPGFLDMLPPMRTPVAGLFMADTSYYYPEDRSINESIDTARRLVKEVLAPV
jgi:protoporphyrinogen oxidase